MDRDAQCRTKSPPCLPALTCKLKQCLRMSSSSSAGLRDRSVEPGEYPLKMPKKIAGDITKSQHCRSSFGFPERQFFRVGYAFIAAVLAILSRVSRKGADGPLDRSVYHSVSANDCDGIRFRSERIDYLINKQFFASKADRITRAGDTNSFF